MNYPTLIASVALGIAVVLSAAIFFGFKIPARLRVPDLGRNNPAARSAVLPDHLPPVVRRYLEQQHGGQPDNPDSVVAYGRGVFRIQRLPVLGNLWAPMAWTLHLHPGQAFVWQVRLYWWRRMIVDGGDQYRSGKGRFVMGKQVIEGENLDRSEQVVMWLYTLLFAPLAALLAPGARWSEVDEHNATLEIPDGERWLHYKLTFDEHSGLLWRIETQRPASKSGELYPFKVWVKAHQSSADGPALPSRFSVSWEDDIYAAYEVAGVTLNAPVGQVLAAGVE